MKLAVIKLSPATASLGDTAMTSILTLPDPLPSFDRRFAVIDSYPAGRKMARGRA